MIQRRKEIERNSKETQIKASLNIDGKGKTEIKTPIAFLDHMLELFAFHGCFDLKLSVVGDTHIDIHHTNEDIGIVLGKAFKQALGEEKAGIKRFGSAFAPMETTLGHTVIDICGRPDFDLTFNGQKADASPMIHDQKEYTFQYLTHFVESFAKQLGATIIISVGNSQKSASDMHSIAETVFKSLGMALDQATTIDPRRDGQVPSTKGLID